MALRQKILGTINHYQATWASICIPANGMPHAPLGLDLGSEERSIVSRFLAFISETPACFSRSTLSGHFTGSALVINKSMTSVLLTHHKKLGMWLQLGGHADGNHVLHEVALTEAFEESGLTNLSFLNINSLDFGSSLFQALLPDPSECCPLPFDLDCHTIPANFKDDEHLHFDVRYVLVAESESLPVVSDESHDVRWFTIAEARLLTNHRSMHRQFDKIEWIRERQMSDCPNGSHTKKAAAIFGATTI
jgi:8-oxo-dGTP pyrophosphatase MutT (NUDIX family)